MGSTPALSMMTAAWLVGLILIHTAVTMNTTTMEPKLGRPGSPDVVCGTNTNRLVNIGDATTATFVADKNTKRCAVNYRPTTCLEMEMTCSQLPGGNRDPDKCKKGCKLTVKADDTKPEKFCNKDNLGPVFPVRAIKSLKVWYSCTDGKLGKGQRADCTITCHRALQSGLFY